VRDDNHVFSEKVINPGKGSNIENPGNGIDVFYCKRLLRVKNSVYRALLLASLPMSLPPAGVFYLNLHTTKKDASSLPGPTKNVELGNMKYGTL
jgi:hypothetical protein